MKRILLLTACLVATMLFSVSCSGNANRKTADNTTGTEQAEAVAAADETEPDTETAQETAQETETPPEKIDWLAGDFKIELDEIPDAAIKIISGTGSGAQKVHKKAIKSGDVLYYYTSDGNLNHFIFRPEGGKIVSYALVPQAKAAARTVSGWESVEAVLKSELGASVWSEPKDWDKMTKTGTETVAGVLCEVWEISADSEASRESAAEIEAFAALAKALGSGDEIDKMKNAFSMKEGGAKWWIDPTRNRFTARKHVRIDIGGRLTDETTGEVTFFEAGNAHAGEIPDLSTYTIE